MSVQLESEKSKTSGELPVEQRCFIDSVNFSKHRSSIRVAQNLGTADGASWGVDQLRYLRELGYDASAIVPNEGSTSNALKNYGVPFESFASDAGWQAQSYWKVFQQIYSLASLLYRKRYHIVQHHILISFIHSRIAAWIADVPVRLYMVATPATIEGTASRIVERLTCWMDTKIIAGCKYSLERYKEIGVSEDRQKLIYYGTDASKFDPYTIDRAQAKILLEGEFGVERTAPVVGRVSYFYPPEPKTDFLPPYLWDRSIKDHESLIDSIPFVLKEVPSAKFVLVGSGWGAAGTSYIESLKQRAASLGVSQSLIFAGGRSDIPGMLSSFDVSVQCSLLDGLGGTAESLLMERPVVATRTGGFTDTVIHESTGLLVDCCNPEQLANAIVRLLKDQELTTKLGKNGRSMMLQSFCLDSTIESLDALYRESVESASNILGFKQDSPIGHRLPVVFIRALFALPVIAVVAYFCGRADIHAKLRQHADSFRRGLKYNLWTRWKYLSWNEYGKIPFLALKQSVDTLIAFVICVLTAPIWIFILLSSRAFQFEALKFDTYLGVRNAPFQACTYNSCIPAQIRWLPLLWSVLKQDMSIVGTRLRKFAAPSENTEPSAVSADLWRMKPGITGWCQLNMKASHSQSELDGFDLLYMAHWNIGLDIKLVLKAVLSALR